jgi:hypothetical protein
MGGFFTRERFGEPQFMAGLLLLVFLGQCVWLAGRLVGHSVQADGGELFRIKEGLRQWHGDGIAGRAYAPPDEDARMEFAGTFYVTNSHGDDAYHSPLYYLIASFPLLVWREPLTSERWGYWGWLARLPYLLLGVLLGGSLWYVSRRLYGNAAGYIALALYCFAPGVLRSAALWYTEPEMGAAWGAFGAVFTAIAVAHTLYAPREVVLWNWRRIVLLGLSLALAVGCQFSLIVTLPLALAFMLYLAPTRRRAAFVIWTAACAIGGMVMFASYSFRPRAFLQGMEHASFLGINAKAFGMWGAYRQVAATMGQISPALVLAVPAALIVYLLWPRARYFGNSAPLLVATIFLGLAVGNPHYPGVGFQFVAVPFLFVFVAGVFTDLLETRWRTVVMACVWGLLGASAVWNLLELVRVRRG